MLGSLLAKLTRLFQSRTSDTVLGSCMASPVDGQTIRHIDQAHVQDLIGKVTQLTSSVAQDVGHHNNNIQSISDELTTVAQSEPTAVAAIICKLLVANQELQGRLQRAEATLQDHTHQLQDAITSARTDSLTGLMNRRALDEELRRCLAGFQRHGRPVALLMLDIDRFKKFNDTFGHLAGDQALIHVASVLREQSRATDIVARFGGEEFTVVFAASTAAAVRERAERLRIAIGQSCAIFDGRELQVTASAGLAEIATGDTIADWVKRADAALYAAKDGGRDCSFLARADQFERIVAESNELRDVSNPEAPVARSISESAVELAAETFADTTFVQSIARRIAEWRRGGATMTVVLARIDGLIDFASENVSSSPIRRGLQMARASMREMDSVTRWHSDGLAFLLPGTSAADATTVIRRLRNSAGAETSASGEPRTPLSFSIGIAEGIEGNDARRVLERAWLALEAARAAGPGNIFIHDGIKTIGLKLAATAH
jgi:diguanylate cyclase